MRGKPGKNPKVPIEPDSTFCVVARRRCAMQKNRSSRRIMLDDNSPEQA
jgi:hypothetical protein